MQNENLKTFQLVRITYKFKKKLKLELGEIKKRLINLLERPIKSLKIFLKTQI